MKIDKKLVKKYLNYKGVNDEFDSIIDRVSQEIENICKPKKLCVVSNVTKVDGYYYLDKLGLTLESEDINRLFCDCNQIAVLVVTLGLEIDRKIAFYAKTEMAKSVVMDAVASVYVEAVLDELEYELCNQMKGQFCTMRFSPGYGDLDIALQKQLITCVGADKHLGINVNENCLMTPLKSITAFIGFSDKKQLFSDICLTCPQQGKCEIKCSKARN